MTIEGGPGDLNINEQGIVAPDPELLRLRDLIDEVDNQLLPLIARRMSLVEEVGEVKKRKNLPIRDKIREGQKIRTLVEQGRELGVNSDAVEQIWTGFFEIAYRLEE